MIKELKRDSGKIFVKADYNREFIDKAKQLVGPGRNRTGFSRKTMRMSCASFA